MKRKTGMFALALVLIVLFVSAHRVPLAKSKEETRIDNNFQKYLETSGGSHDVIVVGCGLTGDAFHKQVKDTSMNVFFICEGGLEFLSHILHSKHDNVLPLFKVHRLDIKNMLADKYDGGRMAMPGGASITWAGFMTDNLSPHLFKGWNPVTLSMMEKHAEHARDLLEEVSFGPSSKGEEVRKLANSTFTHSDWKMAEVAFMQRGFNTLYGCTLSNSLSEMLDYQYQQETGKKPMHIGMLLRHQVTAYEEVGDEVVVHAIEQDTGTVKKFKAKSLYLAAGAYGNTKIHLGAQKLHPDRFANAAPNTGLTDQILLSALGYIQRNESKAFPEKGETIEIIGTSKPDLPFTFMTVISVHPDLSYRTITLPLKDPKNQVYTQISVQVGVNLVAENKVVDDSSVSMKEVKITPEMMKQLNDMKAQIISTFGMKALENSTLDFSRTPMGSLVHEGGVNHQVYEPTLRVKNHKRVFGVGTDFFPTIPPHNPGFLLFALSGGVVEQIRALVGK